MTDRYTRIATAGHEPPRLSPRWVRPVAPLADGSEPVVSDGFKPRARDGRRQHLGVDICFRSSRRLAPRPPHNTRWFYCPEGVPVRAIGAAKIWKAVHGRRGWAVTLDHGPTAEYGPMVSYYTHLAELARPFAKGETVEPGDLLGIVGDDPANPHDLRHLHLEIWLPREGSGREDWAVDPAPYLDAWDYPA